MRNIVESANTLNALLEWKPTPSNAFLLTFHEIVSELNQHLMRFNAKRKELQNKYSQQDSEDDDLQADLNEFLDTRVTITFGRLPVSALDDEHIRLGTEGLGTIGWMLVNDTPLLVKD